MEFRRIYKFWNQKLKVKRGLSVILVLIAAIFLIPRNNQIGTKYKWHLPVIVDTVQGVIFAPVFSFVYTCKWFKSHVKFAQTRILRHSNSNHYFVSCQICYPQIFLIKALILDHCRTYCFTGKYLPPADFHPFHPHCQRANLGLGKYQVSIFP